MSNVPQLVKCVLLGTANGAEQATELALGQTVSQAGNTYFVSHVGNAAQASRYGLGLALGLDSISAVRLIFGENHIDADLSTDDKGRTVARASFQHDGVSFVLDAKYRPFGDGTWNVKQVVRRAGGGGGVRPVKAIADLVT